MIVRSDVAHDSRVLREASTLAHSGHDITVIGSGVPHDWSPPADVDVVSLGARSVFRRSAPRGRELPTHLRLARWALLPRHNASVNASFRRAVHDWALASSPHDVVHAHDMPMLPVGADLAQHWGAALVYDSHEWWSGRRREQRPTPVADHRERRLERRLAKHADLVLTVSPGIADRFRQWGVGEVSVVRNTFPAQSDPREPVDAVTSLLYAGRVDGSRDLETAFRAVERGLEVPITLMGPQDPAFIAQHPVPRGTGLLDPVTPDKVDDRLRAAGAALVMLDDRCENHRLALPNKLYQAVRAGVPVVASDLPEISRVVTEYTIGELYRPGDVASFISAVSRIVEDPTRYGAGLAAARETLVWGVDAARLLGAYARMCAVRGRAVEP